MILQSVLSLLTLAIVPRNFVRHGVGMHRKGKNRILNPRQHMQVRLASKDVKRARLALVATPETAIVQCTPLPQDQFVQLDIEFPEGQSANVIQSIVGCTDHGAFGSVRVPPKITPPFNAGGTLVD